MPPTKTASPRLAVFLCTLRFPWNRGATRIDPIPPVRDAHVPLDFVDFGTIFGTALQ